MTHYTANLRDLEFNLFEVLGLGDRLGQFGDLGGRVAGQGDDLVEVGGGDADPAAGLEHPGAFGQHVRADGVVDVFDHVLGVDAVDHAVVEGESLVGVEQDHIGP